MRAERSALRGPAVCALAVVVFLSLVGSRPARGEDGWQADVSLLGWWAGVEGGVSSGDDSGSGSPDIGQTFAELEGGIAGRVEVRRGRLGFFADGVWAKVGSETRVGPLRFDLTVKGAHLDFGANYTLVDLPVGDSDENRLIMRVLGGGRFLYLEPEYDSRLGGKISFSDEWVDLIVGGDATLDLTRWMSVAGRFDFGGFGIGSSSDLSWRADAIFEINPWECFGFQLGYRVLGVDFDLGKNQLDLEFAGPTLGVVGHF